MDFMYFGFTNKSNVGKSLRTSYQFCIRLVLFKNQKFRKSITIQEVLKQLLSNVNLQILRNKENHSISYPNYSEGFQPRAPPQVVWTGLDSQRYLYSAPLLSVHPALSF